jgi:hypothetical protein
MAIALKLIDGVLILSLGSGFRSNIKNVKAL